MAMPMLPPPAPDDEQTDGPSYGVLLVDAERQPTLDALTAERFSGWAGPRVQRWTVCVAHDPVGAVAAGRQDLLSLGERLTELLDTVVVGLVVRRERLLLLRATAPDSPGVDYVSDATQARPDDDTAWGPEGAEGGSVLAELSGVPGAADEVVELLAEELGESENESERLMALARLLGWPDWLVAVAGLPKRVAGGPDTSEFTRLRVGRSGLGGVVISRSTQVVRRRR